MVTAEGVYRGGSRKTNFTAEDAEGAEASREHVNAASKFQPVFLSTAHPSAWSGLPEALTKKDFAGRF